MRPVSFRYKSQDDNARPSIGLIAEEIEIVCPDMAVYQPGEDGERELLTVDYARLSILLLAEVKKHQARIDELERLFCAM